MKENFCCKLFQLDFWKYSLMNCFGIRNTFSFTFGIIQTFAVSMDTTLLNVFANLGINLSASLSHSSIFNLSISQIAPMLPYLLLVLILIFRPSGLLGAK